MPVPMNVKDWDFFEKTRFNDVALVCSNNRYERKYGYPVLHEL